MDRFVVRNNLQPQTETESQQDGRKSAKTTGRRYLPEWKRKFIWVHYDVTKDKVFCEICSEASESNVVVTALSSADQLTHNSCRRWFLSMGKSRLAIS